MKRINRRFSNGMLSTSDLLPILSEQLLDHCTRNGLPYVATSFWTSNLSSSKAKKVQEHGVSGASVWISICRQDKFRCGGLFSEFYFNNPGEGVKTRAAFAPIIGLGRHLQLDIAFSEKPEPENIFDILYPLITKIRLTFGETAAIGETGCAITNIVTESPGTRKEKITIWPYYKNTYETMSLESRDVQAVLTQGEIPIDVSTLISVAFERDYPAERFLLLWIALESWIGNGLQRKKFCLEELKSQVINDEMMRLATIRGDRVHRNIGAVEYYDISNCLLLIRLKAMPEGETRSRLVASLEARIMDSKS